MSEHSEEEIRADERDRVVRMLQLWVRFDIEYEQQHNDGSPFWERRPWATQGALDLVGRLADTFENNFSSMTSYDLNVPRWKCSPIIRNIWKIPPWHS